MAYTGPDVPSSAGEQQSPLRESSGVLARVTQKKRTRTTPKGKTKFLLSRGVVRKVITLLD